MNYPKLLLLIFCVVGIVFGKLVDAPSGKSATPSIPSKTFVTKGNHTSKMIAEATGIAITPLLGISAVSAYTYYKTPADLRNSLAWYNSPWFWGIGFGITLIFILNSWIGTIIPFLKKPMDVVEHFEGYVSGALALIILILKFSSPAETEIVQSGTLHALSVIVAISSFAAVWLFSNTCSVLILLSPWGAIDLLFRAIRFAVVCLIFTAAALNQTLGVIVSLIVVLISLAFSFWSIRLSIYGISNLYDLVNGALFPKREIPLTPIRCFALAGMKNVPNRTMGYFDKTDQSEMRFVFRMVPLFVKKEVRISCEGVSLSQGVLSTTVVSKDLENLVELSSRYRSITPKIAANYFGGDYSESKNRETALSAIQWIKGIFQVSKK